ncbi:MAG: hypothetical protein AVDCRST_MAG34-770, partial [uncultured Nocardioidaceae bacterium]
GPDPAVDVRRHARPRGGRPVPHHTGAAHPHRGQHRGGARGGPRSHRRLRAGRRVDASSGGSRPRLGGAGRCPRPGVPHPGHVRPRSGVPRAVRRRLRAGREDRPGARRAGAGRRPWTGAL